MCGKAPAEVAKAHGSLSPDHAPYFCLDLSFCHTVLTQVGVRKGGRAREREREEGF